MPNKKISELNTIAHSATGQQFTVAEDSVSTIKLTLRKINPAIDANFSSPLISPIASGTDSLAIGQLNSIASDTWAVQLGQGTNNNAVTLQFNSINFANQETLQAKLVTGTPTDLAPNGSIEIDETNKLLYYRSNNTWVPASKEPYVRIIGSTLPVSTGDDSLAIGDFSIADNNQAVAIGTNCVANGNGAVAIGSYNTSLDNLSLTIGYNNEANSPNSISIGTNNIVNGEKGIAFGSDILAVNNESIAIGNQAAAPGLRAIAIGKQSEAVGNDSIALGTLSEAKQTNDIAIGVDSIADEGIAVGQLAKCESGYFAAGSSATATGLDSIAVGYGSQATATNSVAIGLNAISSANNAIQIGTGTNNTADTVKFGNFISLNEDGGFPIKLQSTGLPPSPAAISGQMIFDTVSLRLWMSFSSPNQQRYLQLS